MTLSFCYRQYKHLLVFLATLTLSACASLTTFGGSDVNLDSQIREAQNALEDLAVRALPIVERISTPFALTAPYNADFGWMERPIEEFLYASTANPSVRGLLNALAEEIPDISFSVFLKRQTPVTADVDFTGGTVGDLIRHISSRFSLDFQPGPQQIIWRDELVRVFDVAHLSGSRTFMLGRTGGGGGGGGSGGSSGGGSGGGGSGGVDSQFANSESKGDFWEDIQTQLQAIIGASGGNVAVSNTSTLVTVRAPVPEMRQVEDFFNALNRQLSIQVSIDVRLIQINLFDEFRFGIDWSVIQDASSDDIGCVTNADGILPVDADCLSAGTANNLFTFLNGGSAGSTDSFSAQLVSHSGDSVSTLLDLLQQQGATKLLTNPRAVTLNNQATQISISTQTNYVSGTSIGVTSDGDAANAIQVETSTLETGFSLICLPKVTLEGDIILDVSTRIASIDNVVTFDSGNSSVQLPTLSESRFFHRARVRSGETLVLGGIREIATDNDSGALPVRKHTRRERRERILLITPRLL
ncbi:MAG: type II secretion system protein GspD [Gammaproteobacteria bacterium]